MARGREEFKVAELATAISHYTDAVRFGDLLFISGLAPIDASGAVVGGSDAVAQTEQIFRNMRLVLDQAGADISDVLKVTIYVTDMADRARINPVRERHFGVTRPASTLVEVSALAFPGMKVEIEAVVGLRN